MSVDLDDFKQSKPTCCQASECKGINDAIRSYYPKMQFPIYQELLDVRDDELELPEQDMSGTRRDTINRMIKRDLEGPWMQCDHCRILVPVFRWKAALVLHCPFKDSIQ